MPRLRVLPDALGTKQRTFAICAAYGAQALGYASVMTSLPSIATRFQIDEFTISLIMLGSCIAAAAGSIIANAIALRAGTRVGIVVALCMQIATISLAGLAPSLAVYLVAVLAYGIGLGILDAAQNAQAVAHEASTGKSLLGRFYAVYTAAAIVGALLMSTFLASSGAVTSALLVTAAVDIAALLIVVKWLHPYIGSVLIKDDSGLDTSLFSRGCEPRVADTAATSKKSAGKVKLPSGRIVGLGVIILAIYTLDSAVSSWSSIYLSVGLHTTAAIAPLGYASYQGAILVSRLVCDSADARFGRKALGIVGLAFGVLGCIAVGVMHNASGAILGFCLAGVATGLIVPITFSAAGALAPGRTDEVIARVNLFNYAGAVLGAVTLGLVASGPGLGYAFLIPGAALLLFSPMLRLLRDGKRQPAQPLKGISFAQPSEGSKA